MAVLLSIIATWILWFATERRHTDSKWGTLMRGVWCALLFCLGILTVNSITVDSVRSRWIITVVSWIMFTATATRLMVTD
jgi:hypothetical protein